MPFFERSCLAIALLEDEQPVEFTVCPAEERGLLGNIYLGIVENIQKNIGAAFVRIQPGLTGYLPLSEQTEAVRKIKGRESDAALRPGDELLVQVAKEAIKQKQLRLTTNLSFSGKYLVLTTGKRTLNFSKRLYPEDKNKTEASGAVLYGYRELWNNWSGPMLLKRQKKNYGRSCPLFETSWNV